VYEGPQPKVDRVLRRRFRIAAVAALGGDSLALAKMLMKKVNCAPAPGCKCCKFARGPRATAGL